MYDKPLNESFKRKLEALKCYASLVINVAIRTTSEERLLTRTWFRVPEQPLMVS